MGFPPVPQELRQKKIGHGIVNSGIDRPWSQYFCCNVAGNREFVRRYPMATKRALRAIAKATNFCAPNPSRRPAWWRLGAIHTTTRCKR